MALYGVTIYTTQEFFVEADTHEQAKELLRRVDESDYVLDTLDGLRVETTNMPNVTYASVNEDQVYVLFEDEEGMIDIR